MQLTIVNVKNSFWFKPIFICILLWNRVYMLMCFAENLFTRVFHPMFSYCCDKYDKIGAFDRETHTTLFLRYGPLIPSLLHPIGDRISSH